MTGLANQHYFSIFKKYADNKNILKNMFEHPNVKDRKIVVLSIVGTKRKGKSYFLNYCLRFLYNHYSSINYPTNQEHDASKWMKSEFIGFSCNHNSSNDSEDILIWNDVFFYTMHETGEKVGIVIVDTQGLANSDKANENKQKIFKFLSTISSILLLNVYNELDENQLDELKFTVEQAEKDDKLFQNLIVLIRDWDNLNKYEYGVDHGNKYLSDFLNSQKMANVNLGLHSIRESFDKVDCSLLPHPGKIIATNRSNISTDYEDMDEEFRIEISQLIEHLLKPANLVVKRFNGKDLNGIDFINLIDQQLVLNHLCSSLESERSDDNESFHMQQNDGHSKDIQICPRPVELLSFLEDNKVMINDENLKEILEHSEVKDREIVVFTIIGAYRKGKSFFLNYCLRFLYAHYPSISNQNCHPDNWMGDEKEPLVGFSWKSGSTRDTSGIVMWNDAFLFTNDIGVKTAIIVMDTQGLFDSGTLPIDNSRIFTLGTLMSSILIVNLSGVVQENQLEYLQYAIESAKFMTNENQEVEVKPFQKLMFLVRDWGNLDDFSFGIDGGNEYLKYFLKSKSDKKEEFKNLCEVILDSFDEISCSLLPHPGNAVAIGKVKSKKYDGNWQEIDEDFKDELKKLIEYLLNSKNLIPRRINGKSMNGSDYLKFIQCCFELFQMDELPQVKTIYDTTIDKEMNDLVNSCFNQYKGKMRNSLKTSTNLFEFDAIHMATKSNIIKFFEGSKKMGSFEESEKFCKILELMIDEYCQELKLKEEENFRIIEKGRMQLQQDYEEKEKDEAAKIEALRREIEEKQKLLAQSAVEVATSDKIKDVVKSSTGAIKKQFTAQPQPKIIQNQDEQLDIAVNPELKNLIKSCINQYHDTITNYLDKISSIETFELYHKMSKTRAILNFEDSNISACHKQIKECKEILEINIERMCNELKKDLEKSFEIRQQKSEQKRSQDDQILSDLKYAQRLAEMEQIVSRSEHERENYEQKLYELKWQTERERTAKIKAEKMRDQARAETVELKSKESQKGNMTRFFGSSTKTKHNGNQSMSNFYYY